LSKRMRAPGDTEQREMRRVPNHPRNGVVRVFGRLLLLLAAHCLASYFCYCVLLIMDPHGGGWRMFICAPLVIPAAVLSAVVLILLSPFVASETGPYWPLCVTLGAYCLGYVVTYACIRWLASRKGGRVRTSGKLRQGREEQ